MTPLDKAIDALGGNTALATAIDVKVSTVGMWKGRGAGRVPAEYCLAIERATRLRNAADTTKQIVTCEMLRPDLDWGVVRSEPLPGRTFDAGADLEPAAQGQGA